MQEHFLFFDFPRFHLNSLDFFGEKIIIVEFSFRKEHTYTEATCPVYRVSITAARLYLSFIHTGSGKRAVVIYITKRGGVKKNEEDISNHSGSGSCSGFCICRMPETGSSEVGSDVRSDVHGYHDGPCSGTDEEVVFSQVVRKRPSGRSGGPFFMGPAFRLLSFFRDFCVEFIRAIRTNAMAEFRFRVFTDIRLNLRPIASIIANLLAACAYGQQPSQCFNFPR